MDVLTPRQADIVALAKSEGRVSVEALADRFNVTPQTIRKDLNDLCERGVLQRYHGGAVLASGIANFGYEARRSLATEEKRRIGLRAADLIPDNSSILINIGTTTEQVAVALRGKQGLLAITNNINVVNILQGFDQIEVIVAGGVVRHSDGVRETVARDPIPQPLFRLSRWCVRSGRIRSDDSRRVVPRHRRAERRRQDDTGQTALPFV